MKKFSIIIPTYQAVAHLDICLKSLTKVYLKHFEVIVICDGFFSLHQDTIEKYSKILDIKVLKFDTKVGMVKCINFGVYSAQCDTVLIMNDDNIVPKMLTSYVDIIKTDANKNFCVSFRQIEPNPSIFHKIFCQDFGKSPEVFDWKKFEDMSEHHEDTDITYDEHLGTFPFVINKQLFMTVGGFDYDYKSAFVTDWDFFIKVSNIVDITICNNCYFYHFKSVTSDMKEFKDTELDAHHFFNFKWGRYGKINPEQTSYLG